MNSKLTQIIQKWRFPALLLTGIGISGLGDFIYLVAINLLVLNMTGSAAAVAGLWIVGPITSILINFWSGSIIDRANKRKIMIITDLIRAIAVAIIPLLSSIWSIYALLFIISIAKSFFNPTSTTYITALVPKEQRKTYNSINSLVTSGAFIVGPAVAGLLFMIGSVESAIYINAVSFVVSAIIIFFLPNIDVKQNKTNQKLHLKSLLSDWKEVITFAKKEIFVFTIYSCFIIFGIFTLGMDSQEVVFTQKVIGLTEVEYSLLISITGIGYTAGALLIVFISRYLSIRHLIGIGIFMLAVGYFIYSISNSFVMAATGFIILGFFNAFSNTGFTTFYQNNIPVEIMGRVTSIVGVLQSGVSVIFLLFIGLMGDILPLRYTIVTLSGLSILVAIVVILLVFKPKQKKYFSEVSVGAGK
ncbi:MFS transporter [Ferdinandcohnia quinoae]|uniref:MFS transporter n=1 Tax=Fredinandcohnia quinoae TaxID=2918902 RepID=A0AAW5EDN1_9BACI|nr:MFS transporter [Fredinandcohnia sp. SECRCQ15]MCH1626874.1 MFS transporter [Fredinandcohnia sp. SECRCQ15]